MGFSFEFEKIERQSVDKQLLLTRAELSNRTKELQAAQRHITKLILHLQEAEVRWQAAVKRSHALQLEVNRLNRERR